MNARRLLGLILLSLGLAIPLIYFRQPPDQSIEIVATTTPTRIIDRLVPSATPKASIAAGKTPSISATPKASIAAGKTSLISATPKASVAAGKTPLISATPKNTAIVTVRSVTVAPPTATAASLAPTSLAATETNRASYTTRQRFGVGVALPNLAPRNLSAIGAGWYLDWNTHAKPYGPANLEFVQMVRLKNQRISPDLTTIAAIARQQPGSLWLIGNEPDVPVQDNVTPPKYAAAYQAIYTALKAADPTSRVAIGGITQPTPLRLQYLDLVLAAYRDQFGQAMPIDVWNVHNFILQEKRGDWGVDIPPGLSVDAGTLYTIDDHDNLLIFRQQIIDFRRWMADRGYRNSELIVSEYGVLMPPDYGFSEERVRNFMLATFDFFMTATDTSIGLPSDGQRLVQRWCWYSLSDTEYPTGNLIDNVSGQMTALGQAYAAYIQSH
jgi:Glycosyl hydrolase catalytic core